VLPPTKGPHPAIVIVLGSSEWVRGEAESTAQLCALNGVAALIYDKRGCGGSTGDHNNCNYDDFTGDALAGLELLKNRSDINPRQIGLLGASEGGWIVSLAASRCADVAFIINISGPGKSPEATSAYQVEHWMKAAGYSKADVAEARSLFLVESRYERTGSNWNEVVSARKADQNKPWYNLNLLLLNDVSGVNKKWAMIADYDPLPALHKVHCPVLAIFGESDPLVPARESAEIWKSALREADNHDVVIKVFPHACHAMADPRTGAPVPGIIALQHDWLLKHVQVKN
jgi:pimeloyl-ACP methyl ester carboxylesterase